MTTLLTLYFYLLGVTLGSFYNVVGLRVPNGELFKQERSYCPNCHHTLSWYELIPVLSFFIQKGLCRHCHQRISSIYPSMEILSGLAFAFSYWRFGFDLHLILALLLLSMFHIIVVSDLRYMIIPNKVLIFFTVIFIIYRVIVPLEPWWGSVVGAMVGLIGTALIIIVSRGGMGGGDMKLFAVIGLALGTKLLLVTFFLASLIGAVVSITLLGLGIITRKKPIPFGPFIVTGGILSLYYGPVLIKWYVTSFF
ncbi:prepilin peptidase [Halobacillus seohaensis]|uniref:Prepilin peptidase n=1 Tax=Halobacillus seohaensis TaxID=447421 RepID=A0ABW2EKS9_9BACI